MLNATKPRLARCCRTFEHQRQITASATGKPAPDNMGLRSKRNMEFVRNRVPDFDHGVGERRLQTQCMGKLPGSGQAGCTIGLSKNRLGRRRHHLIDNACPLSHGHHGHFLLSDWQHNRDLIPIVTSGPNIRRGLIKRQRQRCRANQIISKPERRDTIFQHGGYHLFSRSLNPQKTNPQSAERHRCNRGNGDAQTPSGNCLQKR